MNDDEIERLILELRAMLDANDFGWVLDQIDADLPSGTSRRRMALAIIEATESVTVDLADIELEAAENLAVETFVFRRDDDDRVGSGSFDDTDLEDGEEAKLTRFGGSERRSTLRKLSSQRSIFEELRRQISVGD